MGGGWLKPSYTERFIKSVVTPPGDKQGSNTSAASTSYVQRQDGLTPSPESANDPIIWRCISYRPISAGMGGFRQEVMYDDMVATERLSVYMKNLEERGIEKVTVKLMGTLSYVMQKGINPLRAGAVRMANEKKNHKLEEYGLRFPKNNLHGAVRMANEKKNHKLEEYVS